MSSSYSQSGYDGPDQVAGSNDGPHNLVLTREEAMRTE